MRCGRDLLASQPGSPRRRKSDEKFRIGGSGRLVAGSTAGSLGLELRAALLGPSVLEYG